MDPARIGEPGLFAADTSVLTKVEKTFEVPLLGLALEFLSEGPQILEVREIVLVLVQVEILVETAPRLVEG